MTSNDRLIGFSRLLFFHLSNTIPAFEVHPGQIILMNSLVVKVSICILYHPRLVKLSTLNSWAVITVDGTEKLW